VNALLLTVPLLLGQAPPSEVPPQIFVPEHAIDLRVEPQRAGHVAVRYDLSAPFPATQFHEAVENRLQDHGYRPAEFSILDPRTKREPVRGWSEYLDESRQCVRETGGEWIDPAGNVVQWWIRYTYPSKGVEVSCDPQKPPSPERLRFVALAFPATVAERVRKRAEERKGR
jgi:hypothetical protein